MKTRELKRILDGASDDWEPRGPIRGFRRELFDGVDVVVKFHRYDEDDVDGEEIAYMTARIEGDREFAFSGQYRSLGEIDADVRWWIGRRLVDMAHEVTGHVPEHLSIGEWLPRGIFERVTTCASHYDEVTKGAAERLYELRIAYADGRP